MNRFVLLVALWPVVLLLSGCRSSQSAQRASIPQAASIKPVQIIAFGSEYRPNTGALFTSSPSVGTILTTFTDGWTSQVRH